MQKALIIAIGLLILLVITILSIPRLINWNSYKPRISAAIEDATGRELRIDGDLRVSIFPDLELSVEKVHLANISTSPHPDMFSVESIRGRLRLLPLLSGEMVVDSIVIQAPEFFMEIDEAGRSNWDFGKAAPPPERPPEATPPGKESSFPISELRLRDLRVEGGAYHFTHAVTGQRLEARDIKLVASLPDIRSPLAASGRLVLNDEPVAMEGSIDSLHSMFSGNRFKVKAVLDSDQIKVRCDTTFQHEPVPALDGSFRLDVPSVSGFYGWLNLPIQASKMATGPLSAQVGFVSEGKRIELKKAVIESEEMRAAASGVYDWSGEVAKLELDIQGGVLDFERFFPAVRPEQARRALSSEQSQQEEREGPSLELLSDKPFDLSGLRKTEASVNIALGGIKAGGLDMGRIHIAASLKDALLAAEVRELRLYGGGVEGAFKLDATGDILDAQVSLKIDRVRVDNLTRTVRSGNLPAATGVASGNLVFAARGGDPRNLIASVHGHGTFSLSDADVEKGGAGMISRLDADLDLPGVEKPPVVKASFTYNKEPVTLDLTLAPLRRLFSGDRLELKARMASKTLSATFDGELKRQPVLGLDGSLHLDVPSVGRLAAWIGHPPAGSRPDPGPLRIEALLVTEDKRVTIKKASLEGDTIRVVAQGSVDGSKPIPAFEVDAKIMRADLNAWLSESGPGKTDKTDKTGKTEGGAEPEHTGAHRGDWSGEPLDITPIFSANGKARIEVGSVRYRDLVIQGGQIRLAFANHSLEGSCEDLAIAGGVLRASSTLSAEGSITELDYTLSLEGAEAGPLLHALARNDRITGTMYLHTQGSARGRTRKEMIRSLNGSGDIKFLNGTLRGANVATALRRAESLRFEHSSSTARTTDFSRLGGSFAIRGGIIDNRDFKMLAPTVSLDGGGLVALPAKTVDYSLTARLEPSSRGRIFRDGLAGLPIPITVTGPWSGPQFRIDWESVLREAASDPERLKNMPDRLRQRVQRPGIDLPQPRFPGRRGIRDALRPLPGL